TGLGIGLPIALGASRFLESFLFGVEPNDAPALVLAVVILVGAALLAGYVPAGNASRIDPMVAVRYEGISLDWKTSPRPWCSRAHLSSSDLLQYREFADSFDDLILPFQVSGNVDIRLERLVQAGPSPPSRIKQSLTQIYPLPGTEIGRRGIRQAR